MYPSRVEANRPDLRTELAAFRRICLILKEKGNQKINSWLVEVNLDLDKLQKEFSEQRNKLHRNDSSGREKINIEVIKHVKDLKIRAVEMFLTYIIGSNLTSYSEEDITRFTSNFSEKIGSGGFANVYKGQLPDGTAEIAVKDLNQKVSVEEMFINEVSAMINTSHCNIIKFYGYCFHKNRSALVYEYMKNGSLDKILLEKDPKIEWQTLYAIAIKTAKALDYLHRFRGKQIIHQDVKPANVLLDGDFSPKLTDFGTARTMNATHISMTIVKGTCGYISPEMALHLEITYKSDVYAFGKMLFDILDMRDNTQSRRLTTKEVWDNLMKGELDETIKECSIPEKDREDAKLLSKVALWCVQFTPCIRPSMERVIHMLVEKNSVELPPDPSLPTGNDSMQEAEDMNKSLVPHSIISSPHENTYQERQRKELIPALPRSTPQRFSHLDIKRLTSNFSTNVSYDEFGDVYKGELTNGVQVIVKVLAEMEDSEDIFLAEVSTMAMTCHANLIKLCGYCFDENMKALVHEYVESKSLRKTLYEGNLSLEWEKLYAIAIEIAKVISYLHDSHHKRIVHCGINSRNVLLDSNYSPMLKSFEFAKLLDKNENHLNLTRFRGTPGYTAPEMWRQVTSKCDVYNFGIMLFEILGMGSNSLSKTLFPRQVWDKFKNGQLDRLIKECGIRENDREKASVLSKVALWCVQLTPNVRPSMRSVVNILENEIQVTTPPNPFFPSNLESIMQSSREAVYSVFSPNNGERLLDNKLQEMLANPFQRGEFSLRPLQDIRTTNAFEKRSIETILESIMQPLREPVYSVLSPNNDERLLDNKLQERLTNPIQRGELSLRPLQDIRTTNAFEKRSIETILGELPTYTLKQFSAEEIMKIRHYSNWAGSNDFADFHTYTIPDNKQVCISVLKITDDVKEDEFMNEMRIMGNIDHPNFVKCYGYCFDERMKALVHEYAGLGNSLDELLNEDIPWEMLYDIVVKTAKAISYLHNDSQEQIITYEVNPANVFQYGNLFTKFRFIRWGKVCGDAGRYDNHPVPETWIHDQQVTCKLDVYNFGMMLFEVLGKLRNDEDRHCYPRHFWETFESKGVEKIMKEYGILRRIREKASILCMVGFWCIQYTPELRPSMNTVVNILENVIQVTVPPNPFLPSMKASSTSMKPSREPPNPFLPSMKASSTSMKPSREVI